MAMVEYITEQGQEMLAQSLAGKITITFTRIQMGDGTLAAGQSRKSMTALVNVLKEIPVYSVRKSDDNTVSIMGIFDNSELSEGFYFREKGIFASDGKEEILFAYANAGSSAEYINPPTTESVEKQIISLYKNLQDTDAEVHIAVVSGIYALDEDLQKIRNEKADKSIVKSAILLSSSWTGDTAPYYITIDVEGATATNNIEILPAATLIQEQYEAMSSAGITGADQAEGSVTLKAFGDKPKIDLPIIVIVRGD